MNKAVMEKLREGRRISKMRLGQEAPSYVTLPSNEEVRFAIVPLIEKEYQACLEYAASIVAPENSYGIELRDRSLQMYTLWMALRDPDNLSEKVFDSVEQMLDEDVGLEPTDINFLMEMYQREIDFSSPSLDGLSDEALVELKKALVTIDWNGLSGKPWWHLKGVFMTLPAGLPLDNSPSLSSILSLIGMSESPESTPGA